MATAQVIAARLRDGDEQDWRRMDRIRDDMLHVPRGPGEAAASGDTRYSPSETQVPHSSLEAQELQPLLALSPCS